MILKDFIEQFVEKNTLVRLWYKTHKNRHKPIAVEKGSNVSMEWAVLKGAGPYGQFLENEVIGVTDILVMDSHYPEAVNIVIKENED